MFDRIAGRYDFLNRLLSFRRDIGWRRALSSFLPDRDRQTVLDLATGTGDTMISLLRADGRIKFAAGLDLSGNMLSLAQKKLAASSLRGRAALALGDCVFSPFRDGAFDAVTIAFGIRNVTDIPAALREMRRTLKPGGRALILELTRPESPLARSCYFFYLRHILPTVGCVISGDKLAYRYLNSTIETFLSRAEFCALMREAGFESVEAVPLTLGIVNIFRGDAAA